ncbi:UTP--glucose-1-phosphate uridylyltransferase [Nitrospina gracilis]|uniref:UTP--glucose-1-phosphate uridylyltransferase n=1 Tax=Nitrospina gracilis TaxID=35801 RepID=UPI001F2CA65B|nr:UTP--glucose-1-phosphate uridylyltransferase [Nitrospina gracilis]MCF8720766.1 UTP--glucose-1-phosphate uridylyltransferase [Nitrospina gracilis Nb-211]
MEISEWSRVLEGVDLTPRARRAFLRLVERHREGADSLIDWDSIHSPQVDRLVPYENLEPPDEDAGREALAHLAVCKLNGGLGTSMGCPGPKSLIPIRDGLTFLDFIMGQLQELEQTWAVRVPLILMNSFYTEEQTALVLSNYPDSQPIECFTQNRFPRLDKATGRPLKEEEFGQEAWYPPGHGDLYTCLEEQGILDRLRDEGKKLLFVSNADNLGATADPAIAHHMLKHDIPFLMEMTPKTSADVKGGTLYEDSDGRLHLLEVAQVPPKHVDAFCGTEKFRVFNTNNIWIHLDHLKRRLERGPMDLNLIVNEKSVDGRAVIQLETAIGAALEHFEQAVGLVVNRDRFLPVKKTSDLLVIQSDLFVQEGAHLRRNPARAQANLPSVVWQGPLENFEEYSRRVSQAPSLVDLESLEAEGNVWFRGVATLKGRVRLISHGKPLAVPGGVVIENQTLEN